MDLTNSLNNLPQWLGRAIIGAILAALGFFGRPLYGAFTAQEVELGAIQGYDGWFDEEDCALALLPGWGSDSPPPPCPTISVDVDASDTKTHRIPSKLGISLIGPAGKDHFVTVKGSGNLVLTATIDPDTPQIRNQLTWEAGGATITSPAAGSDRLTAKIPRSTPSGAKIPVRIKVGPTICKEFLVWIVWCTLTPAIDRTSSIDGTPLGIRGGRTAGQYESRAGIDWTARIQPAEIITDLDRPAIEDQRRVSPPGDDKGVADSANKDVTGSGFSGWDISRQKRRRVFKGNPSKTPPEPITQATNADNYPMDRPIMTYPANGVEGNDDTSVCADEDSNPYDDGPNLGTRGTLRSYDQTRLTLVDGTDHSGNAPGEDGDTYRRRFHCREFARVQLGTTWYRCSDFGLWRWHMNAMWHNGQWNAESGQPDELQLDNSNF